MKPEVCTHGLPSMALQTPWTVVINAMHNHSYAESACQGSLHSQSFLYESQPTIWSFEFIPDPIPQVHGSFEKLSI